MNRTQINIKQTQNMLVLHACRKKYLDENLNRKSADLIFSISVSKQWLKMFLDCSTIFITTVSMVTFTVREKEECR
jgi:hypothetical protein